MTTKITVIDYGVGNLFSVMRALEHVGAESHLIQDPEGLTSAEAVILPGVGAFAKGMKGLMDRGFVDPIRQYTQSGRPLLGICLGMQMLASRSEEFGEHVGLDLIPGRVLPIVARDSSGRRMKVPHIGWSRLEVPPALDSWAGSILEGVPAAASTYFVHSFSVVPDEERHRLADTQYGDCRISAAIRSGSIVGCQFHPERSGPVGLNVLRRFVASSGAFPCDEP